MKDNDWHYAIDVEGHFEKGLIVRYKEPSWVTLGMPPQKQYAVESISRDKSASFLLTELSFNQTFREISVDYLKYAVKAIEGDELKKMLRESKPPQYPSLYYSAEEKKAIDDKYERLYPAEKEKEQVDKPSPWKEARARPPLIDYREPYYDCEKIALEGGDFTEAIQGNHYVIKTRTGEYPIDIDLFSNLYEKLD